MTHLLKKLAIASLFGLLLVVSACGSGASPESVAEKISNNEELTKQDYDIMMDYIADGISKVFKSAQNGDEADAANAMQDLDKSNLISLFEKQIPGYSEAVVTSLALGGDGNIDRSPYYPKGVKIEGADETIKDMQLSDQPAHLSMACTVNGKDYYITADQWAKMSEAQKSTVMPRGIVIMKDGEAFVITGLDKGSISDVANNSTRSQLAHLPSRRQAQIIVNDLDNFQNNSKVFGLAGLDGLYYTRDVVPGSDPTAYYTFSSNGNMGSMQMVMGNKAKVSEIKSLYETEPEGFSLASLSNGNVPFSVEIRRDGATYYIPLADYWKIPETVKAEIWGIRINKDGADIVVDVLKPEKDAYLYSADVALGKYYDNLPTPAEAEVLKKNIEEVDAALVSMAGYPLGVGTTKSYFMRKVAEPAKPSSTYTYSYGGMGNTVFLENDGKIDFVEIEQNPYNKAHIRKMWHPEGSSQALEASESAVTSVSTETSEEADTCVIAEACEEADTIAAAN